jgi:predicted alpha/beta superfamily hydrolase
MDKALNLTVEGTQCKVYRVGDKPKALIVQPVDRREIEELDTQLEKEIQLSDRAFVHVAFEVGSWNKDLSPWEAPAVFGKEGFGSGARKTLAFIEEKLIPTIIENKIIEPSVPVIIGGYSLAGLFALWCSYQSPMFKAVAAVSPSVWFPRWMDFAKENRTKAEHIYLSLGDKEAKTKNATMAKVADCITEQQRLLTEEKIDNELQWNSGNHFTEPDLRCAKGFSWCLRKSVPEA